MHFAFISDPPSILKPQNLPDEIHRNWKPQIGMVRATQVASLGMPGHRMLGLVVFIHFLYDVRDYDLALIQFFCCSHYANAGRNPPGQYSSVAPPPSVNSHYGLY